MSSQEKIYYWKPLEDISCALHIHSICNDNKEGFRVFLNQENNTFRRIVLDFYGSVRAFRWSDDLIAFHLLEGPTEPEEQKYSPEWSLFKAVNSEYINWANKSSGIDVTEINLEHYIIWTEDAVLEVLSWLPPKASLIDI